MRSIAAIGNGCVILRSNATKDLEPLKSQMRSIAAIGNGCVILRSNATKDLEPLNKQVPRYARDDKPHDLIPRDLLLTPHRK
jgi:hypothetical protein